MTRTYTKHTVPAEWPELRVRIHPDIHAALKAKIGGSRRGSSYYNMWSLAEIVNEELKHLKKEDSENA